MNLSAQSKQILASVGETLANLHSIDLSSLQIMIMMEVRYLESTTPSGKNLDTRDIRRAIEEACERNGHKPPSRQTFWNNCNSLKGSKLLYIAKPKKLSTHRVAFLTQKGEDLFTYPKSLHPFKG